MSSEMIVGLLAFFTIGGVIVVSIGHFGFFLRDPRNRQAVGNVLAGGISESTRAGERLPGDTTLKERLDASLASRHPDDPEHKSSGVH